MEIHLAVNYTEHFLLTRLPLTHVTPRLTTVNGKLRVGTPSRSLAVVRPRGSALAACPGVSYIKV